MGHGRTAGHRVVRATAKPRRPGHGPGAAVRPRPGSAALTWLYIYDRHAEPGARYGLLEGTCGGQYVTASDLADGTANRAGDLTIVAPNLTISARAAS
jgi:hypothetical protein